MGNRTISVLVRLWYDRETDTTQLQILRTDNAEKVHTSDISLHLRIWVEKEKVVRCSIRHIASGREAYLQGGPRLLAFVNDFLLNGGRPEHDDHGKTET